MNILAQLRPHLVKSDAVKVQLILQIREFSKFDVIPKIEEAHGPVELLPVIVTQKIRAQDPLRLRLLVRQTQVAAQPRIGQVIGQRVGLEIGLFCQLVYEPHEVGKVGLDALKKVVATNGSVLGSERVGGQVARPVHLQFPGRGDNGEYGRLHFDREHEWEAVVRDDAPIQAVGGEEVGTLQLQSVFELGIQVA